MEDFINNKITWVFCLFWGFSVCLFVCALFFFCAIERACSSPWKRNLKIVMVSLFLKVQMPSPTKCFVMGSDEILLSEQSSQKGAFELMKVRDNQSFYLQRLEALSPQQSQRLLLDEDPPIQSLSQKRMQRQNFKLDLGFVR